MVFILTSSPISSQSCGSCIIRQTQTRSNSTAAPYFTHCPVESRRVGRKVRQHTLLNLGANFDLTARALVIMDAGIASGESLQWLTSNRYNYLVVSREKKRDIEMEKN